jgi:hypothetical protein
MLAGSWVCVMTIRIAENEAENPAKNGVAHIELLALQFWLVLTKQ